MIVTINSQVLAAELRLLIKVVPTKPVIAALGYILMRAGEGVRLYATDLEVGLNTSCAASVEVPGITLLPAAKLLAMVEQFPDADVSIASEKLYVIIRCGAFKSKLQVLSVDDFPVQQEIDGTLHVLDAVAFRQLITRARYAVAATAQMHVLRGALLTLTDKVAAMVATDGKRLALATTGHAGTDARIVIPSKALDILAGWSDDGHIELTASARHLFFAVGGRLLTSRTIDGEFPKYERIIPRDNDKVITVERSLLTAAIRRVALASEETQAVYFNIGQDTLELSAASAGIGSANEVLSIKYEGPPLKACMNGSYVLNFLEAAAGQTITIALKDINGAALLSDGHDHVGVIMLMRGT